MTGPAQMVLKQALSLDEVDRAELIDALVESVGAWSDPGIETAWRKTVEQRVEQLEAGALESRPWAVVRSELSRKLS